MTTFNADRVQFDVTLEVFELLNFAIGIAAGASKKDGNDSLFWQLIGLVNTINKGNPHFTQYEILEPTDPDYKLPLLTWQDPEFSRRWLEASTGVRRKKEGGR